MRYTATNVNVCVAHTRGPLPGSCVAVLQQKPPVLFRSDAIRTPATDIDHRSAITVQVLTHMRLAAPADRKSTRLNSSHGYISYAVFCLKKKTQRSNDPRRALQTLTTPTH